MTIDPDYAHGSLQGQAEIRKKLVISTNWGASASFKRGAAAGVLQGMLEALSHAFGRDVAAEALASVSADFGAAGRGVTREPEQPGSVRRILAAVWRNAWPGVVGVTLGLVVNAVLWAALR